MFTWQGRGSAVLSSSLTLTKTRSLWTNAEWSYSQTEQIWILIMRFWIRDIDQQLLHQSFWSISVRVGTECEHKRRDQFWSIWIYIIPYYSELLLIERICWERERMREISIFQTPFSCACRSWGKKAWFYFCVSLLPCTFSLFWRNEACAFDHVFNKGLSAKLYRFTDFT